LQADFDALLNEVQKAFAVIDRKLGGKEEGVSGGKRAPGDRKSEA
jgi:hypothetical protein